MRNSASTSPDSPDNRSLPGFSPSGKEIVNSACAQPEPHIVEPLAHAVERQGDFELIASIADREEGAVLARALVAAMFELTCFRAALNAGRFHALWPHILNAGATREAGLADLINELASQQNLVDGLKSESFDLSKLAMYTNVIIARQKHAEAADLAGWVANALSRLTRDQWQAVMVGPDDMD